MNHSRSPWLAANASGGRTYNRWGIFSEGGVRIATMQDLTSSEMEHSNAVTMAAAPELRDALLTVLGHYAPGALLCSEWSISGNSQTDAVLREARAALSKAGVKVP